jgi:hypothetical protein
MGFSLPGPLTKKRQNTSNLPFGKFHVPNGLVGCEIASNYEGFCSLPEKGRVGAKDEC